MAELQLPPFPRALAYLWAAYLRMRRRKAAGFNGPNPLEWPDVDAFVRCSAVDLRPWEIELIERIDDLFLSPEAKTVPTSGAAPATDSAAVKSVLLAVAPGPAAQQSKKGRR